MFRISFRITHLKAIWLALLLLSGILLLSARSAWAQRPGLYTAFDLGTLGNFDLSANALNSSGQVVGNTSLIYVAPNFTSTAFLWNSVNGMRDLGTLIGPGTWAGGISDSGQIIGASSSPPGYHSKAFLWDSVSGKRDLGTLGGPDSIAEGINSGGQVVGEADLPGGSYWHAFIWDGANGMRDLGTLGGSRSTATAINGSGQVVGGAEPPSSSFSNHAFIWDRINGMRDLGTLGGPSSLAKGINDGGQVVGEADLPDGSSHGFLWDRVNGVRNLEDLLGDSGAGWSKINAEGINDRGWICGDGLHNGVRHAFLLKPTNIVQVSNSSLYFQTAGQSIWTEGPSAASFDTSFGPTWNTGDQSLGLFFHVPLAGEFGLGVTGYSDNGRAQLHLHVDATAGGLSINYPVSCQLVFPDRGTVLAGQPFSVHSTYTVDPAAVLNIASPKLDASLDAVFHADNSFRLHAEAFGDDLVNAELLPGFLQHIDVSKNLFTTKVELNHSLHKDFNLNGYLTGFVQFPNLSTSGMLDAQTQQIAAHNDDTFFSLTGDITKLVSTFLPFPLTAEVSLGGDSVKAGYKLAGLTATTNLRVHQDFAFASRPHVHLVTSDGQTGDFDAGGGSATFTMPQGNPALTFTPTFSLGQSVFSNATSLIVVPKMTVTPLELYAKAKVLGISLGSLDIKPYTHTFDLPDPHISLYSGSFPVDGFKPFTSSPITVTGFTNTSPILDGVSPSSAGVYIAQVTNTNMADLANFKNFAAGTTTLTLSGTNIQPGATAYLSYDGARVPLETLTPPLTTLTMQVLLPNKYMLLPGVGRLTVINAAPDTAGPSNSLDFPIEYPAPQLRTVGPNLWASDPDFRNVALTVENIPFSDGPYRGSDTMIQRKDYFQLLADTLWPQAFGTGQTLEAVFPNFDFNAPAPLPTIFFNGQPLPAYHEPTPSGLIWALLPVAAYDRPQKVDVYALSPGPGGGKSNVVPHFVGAPTPKITSLMPSTAVPGGPGFRLVVRGPATLPLPDGTTTGTGSNGAGNFNAASIVYWGGSPRPTTFVSSSELHADINASDIATGSVPAIYVYNPGATEITPGVFGDQSNLLTFTVINPSPAVDALYPAAATTSSPGFQGTPHYNLSVSGRGFVPGSKVQWNGAARPTQFVSDQSLQVSLTPADVAQPNAANTVRVLNPAPASGPGNSVLLPVTDAVPGPVSHKDALWLSQLTPRSVQAGGAAFTLAVQGNGFCPKSVILWNGSPRPTTFLSYGLLTAKIPASSLTAGGSSVQIKVVSPAPGGGTSASLPLALTAAQK